MNNHTGNIRNGLSPYAIFLGLGKVEVVRKNSALYREGEGDEDRRTVRA